MKRRSVLFTSVVIMLCLICGTQKSALFFFLCEPCTYYSFPLPATQTQASHIYTSALRPVEVRHPAVIAFDLCLLMEHIPSHTSASTSGAPAKYPYAALICLYFSSHFLISSFYTFFFICIFVYFIYLLYIKYKVKCAETVTHTHIQVLKSIWHWTTLKCF